VYNVASSILGANSGVGGFLIKKKKKNRLHIIKTLENVLKYTNDYSQVH
jgi:hypothetical protein